MTGESAHPWKTLIKVALPLAKTNDGSEYDKIAGLRSQRPELEPGSS
jgi:hypothetical protein